MRKNDVIIISLSVIVLSVFAFVGYQVYGFLTAPVLSNKTETVIYIDEGDVIDGAAMINPPEKYSALLEIDEKTRTELGNYMKENGYRLESGEQRFFSFLSFKEMIELENFRFVKMK